MNEKLEQAKNEIAKELNYKDWETCINDQPNYRIEGLMDKVALRYHELMSADEPILSENITKGTKLIAIDECKMDENDENALIIGKCYTVNSANRLYITINSEIDEMHQFYRTELNEFFKISPILKEPNVLQEILDKIKEKSYYFLDTKDLIVEFKDIEQIFSNYLNK